jgi:hypothetical protein
MATTRPFAYNLGPTISGTEQIGSLSIGAPTSGFTNNPQYWNGPDEDLGYVIAQSVSGDTQPTPLSGVTASVGFFRSADLTESSFIELSETISGQQFDNGNQSATWLNSNGYWTSYVPVPDVTGGTGTLISYTTGTFFNAFTSQSGVTTTDAFNSNNGCWQLYYSHTEVTINQGNNGIGLNSYTNGSNSWTWYVAISNSNSTIGDWGSVSALTSIQGFSYTSGGFNTSNLNQITVTIPANRYFLIMNNGGPFYRTLKTLVSNRTAQVGGSNYVTVCNKVALGDWPDGGTTTIPTQFGGSGSGYTFYDGQVHVHSVIFG